MNPVELIANGLFYRTEDGRIFFRPWGSRGPCFLVSERQRLIRARVQLALYCMMIVGVYFSVEEDGLGAWFYLTIFIGMVLSYVLLWAFSRGLPLTDVPTKPSPEHLRKFNRSIPRWFLWALVLMSAVFVLGGLGMGFLLHDWWMAALVVLFFGTCLGVFIWQLRNK